MLSYRHAFHAGNFADVLKHLVLVEIITYLQRKEAGFDYIDTHAGAGLYNLRAAPSQKLLEYRDGVGRLVGLSWPALENYLAVVGKFNPPGRLDSYPGSPLIALSLLRPQDRAWLHELHPADFRLLERHCRGHRKVRVLEADGFAELQALLPPASRRALVLMDPSYEVKGDYGTVVRALQQAHRRFATGVYALWYPVVERRQIERLERDLKATGIRHIQRFELGVAPDGDGHGMTSSGMVVINPTWGLLDTMASLLPALAQRLGGDGQGVYKCDVLAAE